MAKKFAAWWSAHKPTTRRLIQVYAALLYNAYVKGFIKGDIYTGSIKNFCVPGFNCYSCPGAIGACPLGALQNALASSDKRAPYYVLGILMLYGLILGRTICGWLCPLGLIQELFYKIPTPKVKKSRFTHALSYLKYVLLAVFVVIIPLAYSLQQYPVPGFCKYICPAGTFEGAMGLLANPVNTGKFSILNILFTRKFVIMVAILLACVFFYRAFCRFLCPLGAIYGLFARVSILGVKVEKSKCTNCGRCVAHCKMDIRHVGDHECIHCASCVDVCPTKAISMKMGKIALKANEVQPMKPGEEPQPEDNKKRTNRRIRVMAAWTAALVVLGVVMWQVNKDDAAAEPTSQPAATETLAPEATEAPDDDTPVGYEVGMKCPDFTVPLYGEEGGEFTLSAQKGKVTVINFWATWCTPCVAELPYFAELYAEYGDEISLVAIHSNLVTDDVDKFLAKENLDMPFALDKTGAVIKSLGGSTQLPMTVIVDAAGKIVYNKVGSVTLEILEGLVKPLLPEKEDDTPVGYEVGMKCPDFTVPLYGEEGGEFTLSAQKGKVTVINFWATWCTPCVAELPYFAELYAEYGDEISLVAIHSNLVTDDVDKFLAKENLNMPFALDKTGAVIKSLGGSTQLPMTVIVDADGKIVYNKVGSVTLTVLEGLVAPLLAE